MLVAFWSQWRYHDKITQIGSFLVHYVLAILTNFWPPTNHCFWLDDHMHLWSKSIGVLGFCVISKVGFLGKFRFIATRFIATPLLSNINLLTCFKLSKLPYLKSQDDYLKICSVTVLQAYMIATYIRLLL